MINIDHIKKLDSKISNTVEIITLLRDDNQALRSKLENYEKRIEELEVLISNFKKDQSDIENGILNALNQLDKIEDLVTGDNQTSENNTNQTSVPELNETVAETPEKVEPEPIQLENSTQNTDINKTEEVLVEKQVSELDIF